MVVNVDVDLNVNMNATVDDFVDRTGRQEDLRASGNGDASDRGSAGGCLELVASDRARRGRLSQTVRSTSTVVFTFRFTSMSTAIGPRSG